MRHNIVLVVVFLFLGSSAFGQYSLGTGEGLDDSSSSTGRINSQRSLPLGVRNNEIRRNDLLRGSGFTSGIGNSNDASFRLIQDASEVGGEEYQDALYNSPWYWNNWNQQSAQYLKQGDRNYFNPAFIDNWSTSPQQMSEGRTIRSYQNAWNEDDAKKYGGKNELSYDDNWSSLQQDQYRLGQVLGTGYQTPSHDASPIPVGKYQTQSGSGYLAASPLSGVSLETTDEPTNALGFSAWDTARAKEDQENGYGTDSLVQAWRTDEHHLQFGTIENRIAVPEQYVNLLDDISKRAQEIVDKDEIEKTTLSWLEDQYSQLQDELSGLSTDGTTGESDTDSEEGTEEITDLGTEEIYSSLRHGEQITVLSGVEDSRFNELVRFGETAMSRGEYFLAQKRFNQALRFIPGHPLATAGLAHANIGAGLYLSASHVLQSLLTFQPEMIDVLYSAQLLPPRIELVRAGVAARNRLDSERDGNAYAFLLAYLGHQLADDEMIRQGIAELENRSRDEDSFVQLLKGLWLGEEPDSTVD